MVVRKCGREQARSVLSHLSHCAITSAAQRKMRGQHREGNMEANGAVSCGAVASVDSLRYDSHMTYGRGLRTKWGAFLKAYTMVQLPVVGCMNDILIGDGVELWTARSLLESWR